MGGVGGWVGEGKSSLLQILCADAKKCNVEKHFDLKTGAVLRRVDQILTLGYTRLLGYTVKGAVSRIGCVTFNCQKTYSIETLKQWLSFVNNNPTNAQKLV